MHCCPNLLKMCDVRAPQYHANIGMSDNKTFIIYDIYMTFRTHVNIVYDRLDQTQIHVCHCNSTRAVQRAILCYRNGHVWF